MESRMPQPLRAKLALPALALFGIGAITTLAAWTVSVQLGGTFSTQHYASLESSTDGGATWSGHYAIDDAGILDLQYPNPTQGLQPGELLTSGFALRAGLGTLSPVNVTVNSTVSSGLASNLSYEILQTVTPGCSATTTGTIVVPSGTPVVRGSLPRTASIVLPAATEAEAGGVRYFCLKVAMDSSAPSGVRADIVWDLTGAI